jgi:uncharacterized protein (DUF2141 family)
LGPRHRRGNQEWTVQRHRQHWAPDTEGAIKNGQSRDTGNIGHQTQKGQSGMDNPETQETSGTRHRRGNHEWTIQRHRQHWALNTEEAVKNGQSRDISNNGHQTQKGQSNVDNSETQATLGTRHRRGNQELTVQRHRQHWALDTQGVIKNGQSRDTGSIGH